MALQPRRSQSVCIRLPSYLISGVTERIFAKTAIGRWVDVGVHVCSGSTWRELILFIVSLII